MTRTTVEETRQGVYRLINSRTGLSLNGTDTENPGNPFVAQPEPILRDQQTTVESLLEIVDWENDPTSWQYPNQVPQMGMVEEYGKPMDEQYDDLFRVDPPGTEPSPNPAEWPIQTIVDWTMDLLAASQRPATAQFVRLAKARVVTFLNLEAPELGEEQVTMDWIRTQPRPVQDEALTRGFSMMYEVHDWMISQGLTPLTGQNPRMVDLMAITVGRETNTGQKQTVGS